MLYNTYMWWNHIRWSNMLEMASSKEKKTNACWFDALLLVKIALAFYRATGRVGGVKKVVKLFGKKSSKPCIQNMIDTFLKLLFIIIIIIIDISSLTLALQTLPSLLELCCGYSKGTLLALLLDAMHLSHWIEKHSIITWVHFLTCR